ncbi:MAG: DinB family protein [Flammeovirgaceae bacterium]|nr:DinB family protein [Flammeovirgaceae bacterium]
MDKWTKSLEYITTQFKNSFQYLSEEQLNWKPSAKKWSIAQIVDHLIVINETYFPIFDKLEQGAFKPPIHARFSFFVNPMGDMIYNSIKPENKKKNKTLPIWEPTKSNIDKLIIERFEWHQEQLIQRIQRLKPLLEKGTVIHSPGSKLIVYSLEKAIDIIVTHEQRHFLQAVCISELLPK